MCFQASKKYTKKLSIAEDIRKKVEPFIKWLKEAEAESSGDEDEEDDDIGDGEDDIPVVAVGRANGDGKKMNGKATVNGPAVNGKSAAEKLAVNGGVKGVANGHGSSGSTEEEDDVDIDAIWRNI